MKKFLIIIACLVLIGVAAGVYYKHYLYKHYLTEDISTMPTVPSADMTQAPVPMGKLPAGSPAPGDGSTNKTTLQYHTWVWQRADLKTSVIVPKNPGVFTLTFSPEGRVVGKTDCNGFGGTYTLASDGILNFSPFMSTLMYCDGSQEGAYNALVSQTMYYRFDSAGNLVLTLKNNAGTLTYSK